MSRAKTVTGYEARGGTVKLRTLYATKAEAARNVTAMLLDTKGFGVRNGETVATVSRLRRGKWHHQEVGGHGRSWANYVPAIRESRARGARHPEGLAALPEASRSRSKADRSPDQARCEVRRRDPATVPDDSAYWRELSHEGWLALARRQQARFFSKIGRLGPSDCWLWLPVRVDKDGYGRFVVTGRGARCAGDKPKQKHLYAHRLAWELENGAAPPGALMLHACDTPRCCNPAHLSPGTQKENIRQAVERGRTASKASHGDWVGVSRPRGEKHGNATLTDDQVRVMRDLDRSGVRKAEIARRLGVPTGAVYPALAGKTWRHVL